MSAKRCDELRLTGSGGANRVMEAEFKRLMMRSPFEVRVEKPQREGEATLLYPFDARTAYDAAKVSGTELKALGINVVDAPVVDVNTNPLNSADGVRAFGDRTGEVSLFGVAAERGYRAAGIGTQAKHFPGLGDTTVNTDNGVAVTDESRAAILAGASTASR